MSKTIAALVLAAAAFLLGACGGGDSAGDIESFLVETGNESPDAAACVADSMEEEFSLSDFEAAFRGENNEDFDVKLEAAYTLCDGGLGPSSDE